MSAKHREIVARLMERVRTMSLSDLERFVDRIEGMDEDEDDDGDPDESDEDDGDPDEHLDDAARPAAGAWPGNIRLRKPVAKTPTLVLEDEVFKLHAMAEAIGRAKGDPALQIAYATALGRRKAFGDLLEEIGKVPPPYSRDQIFDLVNSLDESPWETAMQGAPGPEDVAALAGQWKCACGWRNNDLRRRCRKCDRPKHTRGTT